MEKGPKEKLYERVEDAEEIVRELVVKYPDELWAINPKIITVLGVTNKERPKSSTKLACISPIKGATRALMQINNVETRYVIEVYWSEWNTWTQAQKVAVIFHELLHPGSEIGKTVKHDVEDFRIMVDKLGVEWFSDPNLPNLLNDKVTFNLALRPNVPKDGNLKVDTGDEIMKKEKSEEPDESKDKSLDDGELF